MYTKFRGTELQLLTELYHILEAILATHVLSLSVITKLLQLSVPSSYKKKLENKGPGDVGRPIISMIE